MTELKPCPFCGGEAKTRQGTKTGLWFIDCPKGCMDFCAQTEDVLIERWNTRAERTCHVEYPDDARMCSICAYHIGLHDLFCSHCGAKVVEL